MGWSIRGDRDERPVSPIVLFTGADDCGPCEPGSPSAFCPHCGSGGRYVWTFVCKDGTKRGAMRGCLQLFPQDSLAAKQLVALERFKDAWAEKRAGRKGAKGPTSWDTAVFAATEELDSGKIDIQEAAGRVRVALESREAWLSRRGFKRRR